jgi:hypothetical protein
MKQNPKLEPKDLSHRLINTISSMSTLTWSQIQTWFDKNAHRHKCVSPYISSKDSIEGPATKIDDYGWNTIPAGPCTPLSAILIAQDTMYNASPESMRHSLLRDETTDLQEKAVLHLKGRAWPVRRTAEGIAACGLEEGRASNWSDLGWRALCALRECQLIIINEEKKQLHFFPEDVSTWSENTETFCVDHECRFVSTNPNASSILAMWLSKKESDGWAIQWIAAEGTMEQLKAELATYNEILTSKCTKDVLTKKVGRAKSLHTLSSWNHSASA